MSGNKRVCRRCYGLEECYVGNYYQCPKCDTKKPTPLSEESARYVCDSCKKVNLYTIDEVAKGQRCDRLVSGGFTYGQCKGNLRRFHEPTV